MTHDPWKRMKHEVVRKVLWMHLHHLTGQELTEVSYGPGCTGVQGVWWAVRQLDLFWTADSRCGCFAHAEESSPSILYHFLVRWRPFWTTRWWALSLHTLLWEVPHTSLRGHVKRYPFFFQEVGVGHTIYFIGVKSNTTFLSALAVRTRWVGHLPRSTGAQDSHPPHGILFNFLYSFTDNLSFIFIVHEAFSI